MTSSYRASLYRMIFAAAAIYNAAFGVWTGLWPKSFFALLEIAPPNYPGIWRCLGMVVGLYGLLYAYAACAGWRLDSSNSAGDLCASRLARPIIAVGLAGKILGPTGWLFVVRSGEWPLRTLTLVALNDLIWWLPFALFLLEGTRAGKRIRGAAPWVCAAVNTLAAAALLFLRGGTEAVASAAERVAYIAQHASLWRAGWSIWMAAAICLVAFYAWWGARLPLAARRWALSACAAAGLGLACDLFAESLWIGWPPDRIGFVGPLASLLSGALANGSYSLAGAMLTLRSAFLRGPMRAWAWAIWASGLALSAFSLLQVVVGMIAATAILMTLFCPFVAVFGWKFGRHPSERAGF